MRFAVTGRKLLGGRLMVLKIRKGPQPLPGCPMSKCMGLLSGLWTLEVLWSLSAGARRFSEVRRSVPGISAKVLTGRLRDLERRGVVERATTPTSPPSIEYSLTPLGEELLPAIRAIVEVGSRLLLRDADEAVRACHGVEPQTTLSPLRIGSTSLRV
jgi:DNA-binding HxlR family transcriptional regulator